MIIRILVFVLNRFVLVVQACHTTNVGKSCGRGVNTRDLGCQQRLADGTTVQSQHCDLKDKPSSFRDCYKPCPGDQCNFFSDLIAALFTKKLIVRLF